MKVLSRWILNKVFFLPSHIFASFGHFEELNALQMWRVQTSSVRLWRVLAPFSASRTLSTLAEVITFLGHVKYSVLFSSMGWRHSAMMTIVMITAEVQKLVLAWIKGVRKTERHNRGIAKHRINLPVTIHISSVTEGTFTPTFFGPHFWTFPFVSSQSYWRETPSDHEPDQKRRSWSTSIRTTVPVQFQFL